MRIAINALPARGEGGRDYARLLIAYLTQLNYTHNYLITVTTDQLAEFNVVSPNIKFLEVKRAFQSGTRLLLWQQFALPNVLRAWRANVLYTLASVDIFLAPCPTVLKLANMAPYDDYVLLEEIENRRRFLILRHIGKLSARTADHVIVMSNWAKQELISRHGFPASHMTGIVHSADVSELEGCDIVKNKSQRIGTDFILSVSHIYRYKNLMKLLEAYQLVRQQARDLPKLVLVGGRMDFSYAAELEIYVDQYQLQDYVIFLGNVPRNCLASLYRSCRFLVFSSLVETCPRTLIEAMKCSTAIMCSNRSVMPEIGGGAPVYFDPTNVNDIGEKLLLLSQNPSLISSLRRASSCEATRFDWVTTVERTLRVLETVGYRDPRVW